MAVCHTAKWLKSSWKGSSANFAMPAFAELLEVQRYQAGWDKVLMAVFVLLFGVWLILMPLDAVRFAIIQHLVK